MLEMTSRTAHTADTDIDEEGRCWIMFAARRVGAIRQRFAHNFGLSPGKQSGYVAFLMEMLDNVNTALLDSEESDLEEKKKCGLRWCAGSGKNVSI